MATQAPAKHGRRAEAEGAHRPEASPLPGPPGPVPASAAPAGALPVPPERNGTVMNHATRQQRRAEELVSWTCGERIRFLWYRLCLTVQEIIIANGQMIELEMGLTPPDSPPPAARSCR
jgi:hypothetical protein